MSAYRLSSEIIRQSKADTWDKAKLEWRLSDVYESETLQTCLCGHHPIREICVLTNKKNGKKVEVGNCCVNKFLGLGSNKVFQALKKVKLDNKASFNAEMIELSYEKSVINEWEYKFYMDIWRKRKLSSKQLEKKVQINEKILNSQARTGKK